MSNAEIIHLAIEFVGQTDSVSDLLHAADKIKKWDQENTVLLYVKPGTTGFDVSNTPAFTNEFHIDMQELLSFLASKKQ